MSPQGQPARNTSEPTAEGEARCLKHTSEQETPAHQHEHEHKLPPKHTSDTAANTNQPPTSEQETDYV